MKLTKYAQSTLVVEADNEKILIDLGGYNFVPGRVSRDFFDHVTLIVITHKHADHFDEEAIKILAKTNPLQKILTVEEIQNQLKALSVPIEVAARGSSYEYGTISVEIVPAEHFVDGEKIDCFGVLLKTPQGSIYHASDTLYMESKPKADIALVPINNRGLCMSINEAAQFVREMRPRIAIPIHYDSPKDAHIDPHKFAEELQGAGIDVRILSFGESFEVG